MILAADNLQAMNPRVAEALKELNPKPLQEIAVECERAGAEWLDINPGFLSKRQEDRMAFMVEAVQEVTSLPLILDSPNPRVLTKGLAVCRDKPILNGLSLEQEKLDGILPLAVEHGTDLVVLLMDERCLTPTSTEGRLALALDLRERCLAAGVEAKHLIFDPLLPTLTWPNAMTHLKAAVETIRFLSTGAVFQDSAHTMAGLSNLRSGQRKKVPVKIDELCLGLVAGAGIDMVLINVLQKDTLAAARTLAHMV